VRKPANVFRRVTDMEAIVKTKVSIYPTAKGLTVALQPQGAAEMKVEFSPLEALKQAPYSGLARGEPHARPER